MASRSKPKGVHSLQVWRFPLAVDHAARARWPVAAELRRVIAAMSTMSLDSTADPDLIRRIEQWALTEGARLEETEPSAAPDFDGMAQRFFVAAGPQHLARFLEQASEG